MADRGPAANADVFAPPLLDGEYAAEDLLDLGDSDPLPGTTSVIEAPTMLMRWMMENSVSGNLPMQPSREIIAGLNPRGVHLISGLRRIFEDPTPGRMQWSPHEYARGFVRLSLIDAPEVPYCVWIDFDLTTLGRVAAARTSRASKARGIPLGAKGKLTVPTAPRWAGSNSFGKVYERAAEIVQGREIQGWEVELPAKIVMANTEAHMLSRAHVLVVPPEQMQVLPEWEEPQEAFDYISDAVLPFDPIYLDFTGPGGIPPTIGDGDNAMTFAGALVWNQEGTKGEELIVAPYGWPVILASRVASRTDLLYKPTDFESLGWFAFNADPKTWEDEESLREKYPRATPIGSVKMMLDGIEKHARPAVVWADACAIVEYVPPGEGHHLRGYAIMPFAWKEVKNLLLSDDTYDAADHLVTWGRMMWKLASRTLAALSITEAVEVEIVDAVMEKRDRKRADKRGWPIAQQVVINAHQKRYRDRPASSGEEAHYSHRFWRRATVAHYPIGTRMADTRPDLTTPCKRPLEYNCGFCRKVKRPAHIVGPPDKPLVLKTLRRAS